MSQLATVSLPRPFPPTVVPSPAQVDQSFALDRRPVVDQHGLRRGVVTVLGERLVRHEVGNESLASRDADAPKVASEEQPVVIQTDVPDDETSLLRRR